MIPRNKHNKSLSAHFARLFSEVLPKSNIDQHEYWLLFISSGRKHVNADARPDWQAWCSGQLSKINTEFMSRFLVEESSPTLKWRQPDDTMNLHELAPPKISLAEAEKTILNMFNALRLMVEDSALIFERLAPQE